MGSSVNYLVLDHDSGTGQSGHFSEEKKEKENSCEKETCFIEDKASALDFPSGTYLCISDYTLSDPSYIIRRVEWVILCYDKTYE